MSEAAANEEIEDINDETKATPEELNAQKEAKNQQRLLRQRMQYRDERDIANQTISDQSKEIEFMKGRLSALEENGEQNKKPDIDDFATDADYMEALTDWKIDQRDMAKKKEALKGKEVPTEAQQSQPNLPQYVSEGLRDMNEAGTLKYDDFSEVINEKSLPFTSDVCAALVMQDKPEDLFYYLAQNPEKLQEIAKKSGFQAAKAVHKLQEDIKNGKTNLTQAPDPITPIAGTNGGKIPLDDLLVKDWIKRRNKEKGINQ